MKPSSCVSQVHDFSIYMKHMTRSLSQPIFSTTNCPRSM